jgi:hypothetical protein
VRQALLLNNEVAASQAAFVHIAVELLVTLDVDVQIEPEEQDGCEGEETHGITTGAAK